jgi:hypothetical protein
MRREVMSLTKLFSIRKQTLPTIGVRQMKSLAAAKGAPPAYCRELLLRVDRPDLANDYDSVRKILKLADALAAA